MSARIRHEIAAYAGDSDRHVQWQLSAFNEQWRGTITRVPYWAALKRERALPDQFLSWEEVSANLPVLERRHLQICLDDLYNPRLTPAGWRATGGSTGQPIRIPTWRSEASLSARDMWHARSWFGISPADRAFLIWGHSHLLGHGVAGWARGRIRGCKDKLVGYRRWSAYRVGDADLREAAMQLLDFQPGYVIGYSVALDRFARVNTSLAPSLRALRLKAVIATAESFPRADSRTLLEKVFGCPVVMEYGAVETGPIAHEVPGGAYRVFWRRYFAEARPSALVPGAYELLVTSLYPRCLPLVRYRIGDLIVPIGDLSDGPLLEFRAVLGRCNDTIALPHGRSIHSEAIAHCVRDAPLSAFQFLQRSELDLTLRYVSHAALTEAQATEIRRRLSRVDAALSTVRLERTDSLTQTLAGKTRIICRSTDLPADGGNVNAT